MLSALATHSAAELSYMYAKHGELNPKHIPPETVQDVVIPAGIGYMIAVGPRIGPSVVAVFPELFGGANPLFGPQGAIRTPGLPKFASRAGSKLSYSHLLRGAKLGVAGAAITPLVRFTMTPGATVSHGPYGSVSVIPKLGLYRF